MKLVMGLLFLSTSVFGFPHLNLKALNEANKSLQIFTEDGKLSDDFKDQFKNENFNTPGIFYAGAYWCPFCVRLQPKLEKIRTAYGDSIFVVGIEEEDEGDGIKRFKTFEIVKAVRSHPIDAIRNYAKEGIPWAYGVTKSGFVKALPRDDIAIKNFLNQELGN